MKTVQKTNSPSVTSAMRDDWFEGIIHEINTDKFMLETGIADTEKENFYNSLITGNLREMHLFGRKASTQYFVFNLLKDYLSEVKKIETKPDKLYLNYNNSKLLVWAIVDDNDERAEIELLKAESRANALHHDCGFSIDTMIMEKSDNYPIPPHYNELIVK